MLVCMTDECVVNSLHCEQLQVFMNMDCPVYRVSSIDRMSYVVSLYEVAVLQFLIDCE